MRHSHLGQTLGQALNLYVEGWRTQVIIYCTTILVALAVAVGADLGFGVPLDEVVKLTIFCTVTLLLFVPLFIITSRLKSSARTEAYDTARAVQQKKSVEEIN